MTSRAGLTADAGLDPRAAAVAEQYVALLEQVRRRSGLSYRTIARQARAQGHVLPASSLATILHRPTLPRWELVAALLTACGVPADRRAVWQREWHRLAGGAELSVALAPRQLPAPPALFAGRGHELESLGTRTTVITGTGGVGKTWLALRWAHDHLDRYPDGQLYLNLRGFDPSGRPTPPDEALATLLVGLGVAAAEIPAGRDAQVGLYRSLMAGKKLLLLLDNARDAEQVRPLLPGGSGCTVLITSRQQLSGLVATDGADSLALDLLAPDEAYQLLAQRLGECRLADEPAAVARIIEQCDRLPLALALVAARAASRPQWTLEALARELGEDRYQADIFAVFSWSYDALGPAAARLFRLLGLHSGPDIGVPAAASLTGLPLREVRHLLAELVGAHLVAEHRPGRFTLHDLLRAYAAERVRTDESEVDQRAARQRILDHYLRTAYAGGLLISPRRQLGLTDQPAPGVVPEPLADLDQALDWFAREHRILVAFIHAVDGDFEAYAWRLADAVGRYFTRQGHWHDWHASSLAALRAAERAGDPPAQAHTHCWLAELYAWIGRYDQTAVHLDRAEELYQRLGHLSEQAYVHLCRGWVYEPRQDFRAALHHAEQALHLYTAAGDPHGQANAINNLGWYHAQLGDYERAIGYSQQALLRHQRLDSRSWQGRSWESLAYAHHRLGRYEQAICCYENAIALFHELGSRYYEARALDRLGDAHRDSGQPDSARDAWQRAGTILHQLHHPRGYQIRTKLAALSPDRPRLPMLSGSAAAE